MCQAWTMSYDNVVWLPNALILTALLAAFAVWRWRSKGALVGMRWAGVALLPLALYAIGVYRLLWSVGLAFSRFFTGFVFRPTVWVGLALLLVAAVLIVAPSRLRGRRTSDSARPTRPAAAEDDMTEIDDILKKHGLA